MDEQNLPPGPTPPSPAFEPTHAPGVRRIKRRLMFFLIGLYSLSVIAACVLLMRTPEPAKGGGKGGQASGFMSQKETVGWVPIHGAIYTSESGRPWEKGAEQWARRIKAMSEAEGVKAIVLDINSPGGSVGAVQELYSEILRVRKEKGIPVVALFGDVAASGGYYIAAACDKIVAHPGSLTGSIGVIFSVSNMEELFKKVGYKQDPIKSGPHKDIGSPARPMTAEERKILQDLIMDAYGQFVQAVSDGRKIPVEDVKRLADGRIYSGRQALDDRLVDVLGDSEDAIALAGKLGHISGTPKVKRDLDSKQWLMEALDSKFHGVLGVESVKELLPMAHGGLEYRWQGW